MTSIGLRPIVSADAIAAATNGVNDSTSLIASVVKASGGSCEQKCNAQWDTCTNKTVPVDVPLFLQNTYRMIDTCDPSIASWSADGKTFAIKDTEKLASNVIPQFFKHNKFSSFVRQLNFYGFKKIRRDHFSANNTSEEEPKHWRFHHEFFVRGRPDLMRGIRSRQSQNSVEREEIDSLKNEVKELKSQVNFLLQHIQGSGSSYPERAAHKKRPIPTCEQNDKTYYGEYEQSKRRKVGPAAAISPPSSPHCPRAESVLHASFSSGPSHAHFEPTSVSDQDLLVECAMPGRAASSGTPDTIQQPWLAPDHSSSPQSVLDCIEPIDIF